VISVPVISAGRVCRPHTAGMARPAGGVAGSRGRLPRQQPRPAHTAARFTGLARHGGHRGDTVRRSIAGFALTVTTAESSAPDCGPHVSSSPRRA
jgi:hypothetical protein